MIQTTSKHNNISNQNTSGIAQGVFSANMGKPKYFLGMCPIQLILNFKHIPLRVIGQIGVTESRIIDITMYVAAIITIYERTSI